MVMLQLQPRRAGWPDSTSDVCNANENEHIDPKDTYKTEKC